jgi:hypothetical protein
MAWDPALVARFLVASSNIVSSRAVISTRIAVSARSAISARIMVSALSMFPLGVCSGGVIVHHAVGVSVRLLLFKFPTSATPTTTTTITSALRIQGSTSRRISNFGHKGRHLFVQSNGIHDVL